MFTSNVVDKIDDFRLRLESINKQSRVQTIVGDEVTPLAQQMLRNLAQEAPKGDRWEEEAYPGTKAGEPIVISHGRPSIRLHGIMLESGWGEPDINRIPGGVEFEIGSDAPQIIFLLEGSDPHPISGNPLLSFWHLGSGQAMVMHQLPHDHPGHPPSNFVNIAEAKLKPDISSAMDRIINKITAPMRKPL